MIRQPPSSITITAKDVDTLDDLKKHLEERVNAQANAQATGSKESEREFFLQRLPSDQPITSNKKGHNATSIMTGTTSSSDFISKRRRLASEAESASQRRIARLERTTGSHATAGSSAPRRSRH
ncbi:hypothetical protein K492DRAFT_39793 [Lichtheimia hyalospora FSU 10163]|nr:hypothetical protein K492DRAFT_39793 [Lichtheimia hyalospora FSU 10163]